MKINEKANLIKSMVRLIDARRTGSPQIFAETLGISRSNLYQLINEFNDMGVKIEYNRTILSFSISDGKEIKVQTPIVIIDNDDLFNVKGGQVNTSVSAKLCSLFFTNKPSFY